MTHLRVLSRRQFLRATTGGLAGVVAASLLAACAPQPPPPPPTAAPPEAPKGKPAEAAATAAGPAKPAEAKPAAKPEEKIGKQLIGKLEGPEILPDAKRPDKLAEAPMLADLVKQSKLPPVEQRVPLEPMVVVLPAASPWIIAGLRVSIPQALVA
ncbi:MAG TPA: twin-arginine translocation signal domain-containing protein, partial [Chloroflexota bacterium]|nr:twin-arginine translocation signal domain-containing protein [Chloroflexota bacterium]